MLEESRDLNGGNLPLYFPFMMASEFYLKNS